LMETIQPLDKLFFQWYTGDRKKIITRFILISKKYSVVWWDNKLKNKGDGKLFD
jgi:hypothetical protein